jgi:hypothetical protein
MKKEELRRIEYAEVSEKEFREFSPLERTKAATKVEKKQGYFHGWAIDTHLTDSSDNQLPMFTYTTLAIVEQTDGRVIKIKPENIRFLD